MKKRKTKAETRLLEELRHKNQDVTRMERQLIQANELIIKEREKTVFYKTIVKLLWPQDALQTSEWVRTQLLGNKDTQAYYG